MSIFITLSVGLFLYGCKGQILNTNDCVFAPVICPNPNITYWLYTRRTQYDPVQLDMADKTTIQTAKFVKGVPTILLLHGYTGHRDFSPNPEIRPAYFQKGEYNVISIDYNPLAREPCYISAVYNVPLIGQCSAELLDELVSTGKVPFKSIHVVGFSLGAQVSGAIANYITSGKLERITGLDPALPLFVTADLSSKLDSYDAKFVDVIHTNALEKGKLEASGDVDFYVNGGMSQPGCDTQRNTTTSSCNHARAPLYFGESINSQTGFYGKKCSSWIVYIMGWCQFETNTDEVIMGEYTPNTARGLYFLDTNSQPPFARGKMEYQDFIATEKTTTKDSNANEEN